jgi:hypothetical protein
MARKKHTPEELTHERLDAPAPRTADPGEESDRNVLGPFGDE